MTDATTSHRKEHGTSPIFWSAYNSVCSGLCAATAGMFGKLSGPDFSNDYRLSLFYFILMIVCNIGVWSFYIRALQSNRSTISVTVSTAACNYLISAAIGNILFFEIATYVWWLGMFLILLGLSFMVHDDYKSESFAKIN